MVAHRPLIAITMGEPGGIGGEISIQAWERKRELSSVFFLLDCPKRIQKLAASISKRCPIKIISEPDQAAEAFKTALPIIPLSYQINTEPGTSNFSDAKAVLESIDRAVMFAKANKIDGMVTNPIQKE
ncbi:MAG: 4-hydroxythreonine-4-phosphate dehydrogenase PdxA, partial [Pseudomonadota bacterium]|nr:4-hydroxythreonine-4-phosphate dehydrogenase PdxA [Pseudomonadota bacterium]